MKSCNCLGVIFECFWCYGVGMVESWVVVEKD